MLQKLVLTFLALRFSNLILRREKTKNYLQNINHYVPRMTFLHMNVFENEMKQTFLTQFHLQIKSVIFDPSIEQFNHIFLLAYFLVKHNFFNCTSPAMYIRKYSKNLFTVVRMWRSLSSSNNAADGPSKIRMSSQKNVCSFGSIQY